MKRVAILLSLLMSVAPCLAQSQTTITSKKETTTKIKSVAVKSQGMSDQPRQTSVKLEEGDRITLRNRFGPIIVTGVGGDTLEATATEIRRGAGEYKFQLVASRSGRDKVMVTTSVTAPRQAPDETENKVTATGQGAGTASAATTVPPAEPSQPQAAQPRVPPAAGQGGATGAGGGVGRATRAARPAPPMPPPDYLRGVGEIKLEVRLPSNAHVDLIDSRRYAVITNGTPSYLTSTRNDVSVTNMETPISIISSGDVQAAKVGGLEARTRASNVYVKDVAGPVSISTVTGSIVVKGAVGDVRAVSITGSISIECAGGRTEAGNTNGTITLMGIGGDLDATTTGGTITFTGAIRDGGRYRLKSMSGLVRMFIQREPPGFLTSLSSYKGQILVDFELKTELSANTATSDLPATQGQPVRRMIGRYGQGDARITLDSFSGTVQLARAPNEVWKKCP